MLYVICLIRSNSKQVTHYRLFDTLSDSAMYVDVDNLKSIISVYGSQVINATMQNNDIVINKWSRRYAEVQRKTIENGSSASFSGPRYILLAKNGHRYKVINNEGEVDNLSESELLENIEIAEVVNCSVKIRDNYELPNKLSKLYQKLRGKKEDTDNHSIIESQKVKMRAIDIYTIEKDVTFEKNIRQKYETFDVKTQLLYHESMTFNYEIEGKEVRLSKYTGSSKKVVLPSFITSIKYRAFWGIGVETIKLNEGLKAIAEEAFLSNRIEEVEIPSTVEIIGNAAFRFNTKLFTAEDKIDTSRFKLLNNQTILLDQYTM